MYWTLAALQQLSACDSITFHELIGDAGVLTNRGYPTPLFPILREIRAFGPKWILMTEQDRGRLPEEIRLENSDGDLLSFKLSDFAKTFD